MKTLQYSIQIHKSQKFVFNKMMDKSIYNDWAKAFSPGSTYKIDSEWKKGAHIIFYDPTNKGGTKVIVEVFEPYKQVLVKHIDMVDVDGKSTELDDIMKKWIGSTEEYRFIEDDDTNTTLEITIQTDEAFQDMFDDSWPKALELFKAICEKS